jgi:acetolactate synthase-1/2/3 large subunit
VVVHNDAYGSMKRDQIRQYGGRVIGTDLFIPDLSTLATSFGLGAERVERPADLEGALGRALHSGKGTVLDVVCPIEGI